METIAFYWEPVIRIYGFQTVTGLSLALVDIDSSQMRQLGESFLSVGDEKGLFRSVFAQAGAMGFQVSILLDRQQVEAAVLHMESALGGADPISIVEPVDLISFQGPHFGDRYGVADAVFKALSAQSVPLLVSGFSGSFVYLVLPGGNVRAAEQTLSEYFTVPRHKGH